MFRLSFFRFCVFWIWSITLIITLGVFIGSLIEHHMTFANIEDSLTAVMGLIVPQLTVMTAFFFGSDKDTQRRLIDDNRGLGGFALAVSALYHVCFWIVITLAVYYGVFGDRIDVNTSAAIKILSFLCILGLSPVAYLFAGAGAAQSARPTAN